MVRRRRGLDRYRMRVPVCSGLQHWDLFPWWKWWRGWALYLPKASHPPMGYAGCHSYTLGLDHPLSPILFERQQQKDLLETAPSSLTAWEPLTKRFDFQWFGHESSPWLSCPRWIIYAAKRKRKLPRHQIPQMHGAAQVSLHSPGMQEMQTRNMGQS